MTYSGAAQAKTAREGLGKALAALQQDPNIPDEVLSVAQNIARAVGGLFEAEHASSERDGKACVKASLGFLSQTLALLQDVGDHPGIATATEVLAKSMSTLYPLTTAPSIMPQATQAAASQPVMPPPAAMPAVAAHAPTPAAPAQRFSAPQAAAPQAAAPRAAARQAAAPQAAAPAFARQANAPATAPYRGGPRTSVEANIGATTQSNFYVGFSGEVSEGGVFLSTYEVLTRGTHVQMLVTLPGGFEFAAPGVVRFVRDPMDFNADSEPGMGVQFEGLDAKARQLVMRFIAKRPPIFYDE